MTTPGTGYPLCIDTVSMIQAITWAFVPTSGAGMSESGPTIGWSSVAKRRVRPSSSLPLMLVGSQLTPPFAPPNGTSTSAHFQVIHIASARTSSRSVWGWKRRPPLAGPRATLCWTRYPENTRTEPLSIFTGKFTVYSRCGTRRTARRSGSISRWSAAASNWVSAAASAFCPAVPRAGAEGVRLRPVAVATGMVSVVMDGLQAEWLASRMTHSLAPAREHGRGLA